MIRVLAKRLREVEVSVGEWDLLPVPTQVHECPSVAQAEEWITENIQSGDCWIVQDMYKVTTVRSFEFEKIE